MRKNFIQFLVAGLAIFASSGLAFATTHPGLLTASNIPTDDVISNIVLVGISMIGVVLAKFGIQAAKKMIG